jgi:hypothetical protein
VTPTHLDVTYGPSAARADRESLAFQVVEMGGIEISTYEVASGH